MIIVVGCVPAPTVYVVDVVMWNVVVVDDIVDVDVVVVAAVVL